MTMRFLITLSAITAATVFGLTQNAHADVFVLGSNYSIQGSDPTTGSSFNSTVTLTSGSNQLIDGGAINLNFTIVPTSGQGEWLVFAYNTTGTNVPLSLPGNNWTMNEVGLNAAVPVIFDAAFSDFGLNGVIQTPTANIFGGYSVESNPVPGSSGTGLGAGGFNADIAAGALPLLGAYIDPFGYIANAGISDNVNDYMQALLFYPQTVTGTPEPSSWILLCVPLAAFAYVLRRRVIRNGPPPQLL